MAKHFSKLGDGHYIIESDEEYKKRTGIGCGTIIFIAVLLLLVVFNKDDDKSSSETKSPEKTEQVTVSKEVKTTVQHEAIDVPVEEIMETADEKVETVEEDKAEPETDVVNVVEVIPEVTPEEDVENADNELSKGDIKAAEKKVNKIYNTLKKACQQNDVESAQAALEEMIKIQESTSSQKIQSKIASANKLIEKIK